MFTPVAFEHLQRQAMDRAAHRRQLVQHLCAPGLAVQRALDRRRLAHELARAGLGLSLAAYGLARRLAGDRRFAFGTWKIEVLAGYTSALRLIVVAVLMLMLVQSLERRLSPGAIHYDQAIAIAALIGGKYCGAVWLDPLMGVLGAVLVTRWAVGLRRQSSRVLLDAEMDAPVVAEIREVVDQPCPPR